MQKRGCGALAGCACLVLVVPARGQEIRSTRIHLEAGAVWAARNVARIPGDTGDRFPLTGLIRGGGGYGRVTAWHPLDGGQGLRLVIAPLRVHGTGPLAQPIRFEGQTFSAGVPTRATYQFHSYRLSWWRRLSRDPRAEWRIGATLKIRDAEVALRQGERAAASKNIGLVPLLHGGGDLQVAPGWRLLLDFDGLAAPQGRAADLGVQVGFQPAPGWLMTAGYRTLEGGADNRRVFSFAWLNYLAFGLGYGF